MEKRTPTSSFYAKRRGRKEGKMGVDHRNQAQNVPAGRGESGPGEREKKPLLLAGNFTSQLIMLRSPCLAKKGKEDWGRSADQRRERTVP